MVKYSYGDFPTIEEIKRDYNELIEIIKDIKTIEQAKEVEAKGFTVEINGMSIDEFSTPDSNGYVCTDKDIDWIRYENYGCLSYIYDRFDGKPMFDVWSEYCFDEFIRDITIDELTEELYKKEKTEALNTMCGYRNPTRYRSDVEFHYDALTATIATKVIPATLESPEDYMEGEYTDEFDFEVDINTVEEVLRSFLTEEDVSDVSGGLLALEDDDTWKAFLDVHFEELLEKYNDKFLEYFRDDAEEKAEKEFQERYAEKCEYEKYEKYGFGSRNNGIELD